MNNISPNENEDLFIIKELKEVLENSTILEEVETLRSNVRTINILDQLNYVESQCSSNKKLNSNEENRRIHNLN